MENDKLEELYLNYKDFFRNHCVPKDTELLFDYLYNACNELEEMTKEKFKANFQLVTSQYVLCSKLPNEENKKIYDLMTDYCNYYQYVFILIEIFKKSYELQIKQG